MGESAQLRALVRYSDDSVLDASQETTWRSLDEAICGVSSTGMVTALSPGRATITAAWKTLSASMQLTAVKKTEPRPQYQITAEVQEAPPTPGYLAGVRVEISGGALSGQVFFTDAKGRVVLPPVEDAGFAVYFKKPGYDDVRYEVLQLPRDASPKIEMAPPPGEVLFTISGSDLCTEVPWVDQGTSCRPGSSWQCWPLVTAFPVYHSGELVLHELVDPTWGFGSPFIISTLSPDGRYLHWEFYWGSPLMLKGGYKYEIIFYGDIVFCSKPFRVVLTHPR